MAKYYIVDVVAGEVYTTDDEQKAQECSRTYDIYVIDAETDEWLLADTIGERFPVKVLP